MCGEEWLAHYCMGREEELEYFSKAEGKLKDFGEAERIYRSLERWHEEHGIRDLASDFAYRKQRTRRKALGVETLQKFKEAFKRKQRTRREASRIKKLKKFADILRRF